MSVFFRQKFKQNNSNYFWVSHLNALLSEICKLIIIEICTIVMHNVSMLNMSWHVY